MARDVTGLCDFSVYCRTGEKPFLTDSSYATFWRSTPRGWLRVRTPADQPAAGIYVSWAEVMVDWAIQVPGGEGTWVDLILSSEDRFYNQFIPLPGLTDFRLECRTPRGSDKMMSVSEIRVFTQGRLPDWVQVWKRMEGDADLMLLSAHPDDELLWFGGTLPLYAGEMKKKVIVACLVNTAAARKSEMLDGLWLCGVREYPVTGEFRDGYSMSLSDIYKRWGEGTVLRKIVSLIRTYRPKVLLTHDLRGEYGHGAHRVCADAAVKAFKLAADPLFRPGTLEPWQVSKLYLHLLSENPLRLDWRRPLGSFGGETSLSVAKRAFERHISQRRTEYQVLDTGPYDCSLFGLHSSMVGPDTELDGFFENIP